MEIDKSEEHDRNACDSMHESLVSDSNATTDRRRQLSKQCWQSFSFRDGMQIDDRHEQYAKADSSIRDS
jgi:hypothetical protein